VSKYSDLSAFFEAQQAREAKQGVHGVTLGNNNVRLFVDYHQSKQERAEYLKLKMINQSSKMMHKGKMGEVPQMMRNMAPNMGNRFNNGVFGPHMLRKFPPQTAFVKPNLPMQGGMFPNQMGQMGGQMQGFNPLDGLDKNARRDFFGEKLYTKISTNPNFSNLNDYFSKIVGIFLDLEDHIIERLITDDNYFSQQVFETIRLLNEKTGN